VLHAPFRKERRTLGFVRGSVQEIRGISLVFREMWDTTTLDPRLAGVISTGIEGDGHRTDGRNNHHCARATTFHIRYGDCFTCPFNAPTGGINRHQADTIAVGTHTPIEGRRTQAKSLAQRLSLAQTAFLKHVAQSQSAYGDMERFEAEG
jgi:hypothetical protein